MSRKLFATASTLAAVATLAFAAVATATSSATTHAAPQSPKTAGTTMQVEAVTVQVQIKRFVKRGGRLFAVGTAVGCFNSTGANPQFDVAGIDRRAFVVPVRKLRQLSSASGSVPSST